MNFSGVYAFFICTSQFLVLCYCSVVTTTMPTNFVNKFQNDIEQQTFYTILNSIEDRLRNLDNIYSLQLSQTLETKLDLYSRRLESLDTKIIRLEALVMLNLDKISENISTKNFKDDISKTNTYRKMDSLYEGLNNKMNYLEKKHETNFEKIQEKLDLTISHLTKMVENVSKRDSDLETELSDAIFAIDDLKSTYKLMEQKLFNITEATLSMSKTNHDLVKRYIMESKRSMNKLHDNIVGNLQYMDNKTSQTMKLTGESRDLIKQMRSELKDDFNNYANKVADMNSDIWKSSDTTEDDLQTITIVVNSTRTELQNGIRSLILQIGKLENKENNIPSPNHIQDIDKKLSTNFEKILMNQDIFMDSCHRLQMDEPKIERQISIILENLIDKLENKFASESKDIRNFEKALKSHDNRVNRNLHQANNNIISLFDKYLMGSQQMIGEMKKIDSHIERLDSFLHHEKDKLFAEDFRVFVNKLEEIRNNTDIKPDIEKLFKILLDIEKELQHQHQNTPEKVTTLEANVEMTADENLRKSILNVFGPKPTKTSTTTTQSPTTDIQTSADEDVGPSGRRILPLKPSSTSSTIVKAILKSTNEKPLCGLLDIRAGIPKNCEDMMTPKRKQKNRKIKRRRRPKIDVRFGEHSNDDEDSYEYYESDDNEENTTSTESTTTTENTSAETEDENNASEQIDHT